MAHLVPTVGVHYFAHCYSTPLQAIMAHYYELHADVAHYYELHADVAHYYEIHADVAHYYTLLWYTIVGYCGTLLQATR